MKRTIEIGVPDLGSVAVFVKVAECMNFSLAADRLGLGKATVSDQVAKLERLLGVRLLVRTTRSVRLTEAGALFFEHCQRVMSDMHAAFSAVGALRAEPKGVLRVSVPVAIGRQLIAPLAPIFLERYPEISLELDATDRLVDFATDPIDLAVRHTEEPNPNLMAWKLREVAWHIVASPSYLKRHGTPEHPSELARHNCMVYPVRGRQKEWKVHSGTQLVSVPVTGNFKANSSEMLREAVLGGVGIGLLPDFSCRSYLAENKMVSLLQDCRVEGSFGSHIWAIAPWTPNIAPAVRAFVDFLKEALSGQEKPI